MGAILAALSYKFVFCATTDRLEETDNLPLEAVHRRGGSEVQRLANDVEENGN